MYIWVVRSSIITSLFFKSNIKNGTMGGANRKAPFLTTLAILFANKINPAWVFYAQEEGISAPRACGVPALSVVLLPSRRMLSGSPRRGSNVDPNLAGANLHGHSSPPVSIYQLLSPSRSLANHTLYSAHQHLCPVQTDISFSPSFCLNKVASNNNCKTSRLPSLLKFVVCHALSALYNI